MRIVHRIAGLSLESARLLIPNPGRRSPEPPFGYAGFAARGEAMPRAPIRADAE